MKTFAAFILKFFGWKAVGRFPTEYKKLVILEAPHTSNLDYFIGMLCIYAVGVKVNVIIKKEAFFWPFAGLLKKAGGVAIDRSSNSSKVDAIAHLFKERTSLNLGITPEGTRSLSEKWKKGFYYIALKAEVPILLTSIDYKKKEGHFGPVIFPSGDFEKDFKKVESFYKGIHARYPEKYSLSPMYLQKQEENGKG